ncbi:MAG: hypothetical protein ACTHU0_31760 [Kofleriaceae bacterium]
MRLSGGLAIWLVAALGCGGSSDSPDAGPPSDAVAIDAPDDAAIDAPVDAWLDAPIDAPDGVPLIGFGDLSGMCGVLASPELTGDMPVMFQVDLSFMRRYVDPADRPLLTAGGRTIVETPNAGGSSVYSEVFAFEELARCELASLIKTETQILYDVPNSKKTDILVGIDGVKIGVSVVRAVAFPFGSPYTLEAATTIIRRKLEDIQVSTANVSAADRWEKQVLAVLAWDAQHAQTVMQAWSALDPAVRADTIVIVTATHGEDTFIYSDN